MTNTIITAIASIIVSTNLMVNSNDTSNCNISTNLTTSSTNIYNSLLSSNNVYWTTNTWKCKAIKPQREILSISNCPTIFISSTPILKIAEAEWDILTNYYAVTNINTKFYAEDKK